MTPATTADAVLPRPGLATATHVPPTHATFTHVPPTYVPPTHVPPAHGRPREQVRNPVQVRNRI